MHTEPEKIDPDWTRYPATVLVFGDGAAVDLRQPIGARELDVLSSHGLTGPFAVVTAHDPRGVDLDRAENEARAAALENDLRSLGVAAVSVDACSPDGEHCECSVAAAIGYEDAIALARRFEQMALFWFDGQRFWIVGGVAAVDPVPLPRAP